MSEPNELEQLMLSFINEERAETGLDPLRFNGDLNEASEDHSAWMLEEDVFSHTGESGSSAGDRIQDAGYQLEGNWTWGENIAWQSERGDPGLEDDVRDLHEGLMDSPGHRANILNPDFEEIGIGIERGDFGRFDSVMVTQNFGATDATPAPDTPTDPVEPPVAADPPSEPDPVDPPVDIGTPDTPPVIPDPGDQNMDEMVFTSLPAWLMDLLADLQGLDQVAQGDMPDQPTTDPDVYSGFDLTEMFWDGCDFLI